jgi:hypothetical protein
MRRLAMSAATVAMALGGLAVPATAIAAPVAPTSAVVVTGHDHGHDKDRDRDRDRDRHRDRDRDRDRHRDRDRDRDRHRDRDRGHHRTYHKGHWKYERHGLHLKRVWVAAYVG